MGSQYLVVVAIFDDLFWTIRVPARLRAYWTNPEFILINSYVVCIQSSMIPEFELSTRHLARVS